MVSGKGERMKSLHQAALTVAMVIAPIMPAGCITFSRMSPSESSAVYDHAMNSGRVAENQGDLSHARAFYQAALKRNPRGVDCLHRLGVVCTNLKDFPSAENYYRQAYAISPGN